jgi:hypothetical protein
MLQRLSKPAGKNAPASSDIREAEDAGQLGRPLTWLLSFPKKEVMVNGPHLQSPENSPGQVAVTLSKSACVV